MKNDYFNKYYDFEKEIEPAILNIVGINFCNIPVRRNSIICNPISQRNSMVFDMIENAPAFIFKKDGDIYYAFDEKLQIFKAYSTKPNGDFKQGAMRKIKIYGGIIFSKLGVSTKSIHLYHAHNIKDIAKEKLGINIIAVGTIKRWKENFVDQKHFYINKKVIDLKLLYCGINLLDYENRELS